MNVGCDRMFFSEITKEDSDIMGCLRTSVRPIGQHPCKTCMPRQLLHLFQCLKNDQQALVLEGQMLIKYVIMNAIALRKILKKYDKVSKYPILSLDCCFFFSFWIFLCLF